MSWLLSSIVGGGAPKLPFTLGEPYAEAWGTWTHYRATSKVCRTNANSFVSAEAYVTCAGRACNRGVCVQACGLAG